MYAAWFYIAVFFALAHFMYINQKRRIRRGIQRERLRQARENYLDGMLRVKKKENDEGGEEPPENKN